MTREEVNYTLGSLFDGSGGFPLAGSLCGITPIWASEVEPYPIAVTRSRFPALQHLGDISKINGAEIPPVDIITFGSPCQDLSVAGKRAGLKHESNGDEETTRSGLFMEAVRIIKEMRGATNGRYPSFAVWENVPGAFSSNKGEDFRVVLEELIKIAEPAAAVPPMPQGGWPYADCYVGDGWSVAYRTFDAQYWGVPQRRRRIHLVADFGGERAGKILFEREGVRGYFTQGRTPWQGTSADAESGPGTADREGNCIAFHMLQDPITNTKISPCIGQGNSDHGQASIGICYAAAFKAGQGAKAGGIGWQEKVSPTLAASPSGTNQAPAVCMKYLFENHSQDTRYKGPLDICPMLPAQLGTGGNNTPFVVEGTPVICLQGNVIDRAETARCNGKGWKEDVSYTLNTIDRPAVAFAMQAFGKYAESDTASAMKARDYKDATDLVVESSLTPWDNPARRIYRKWCIPCDICKRESRSKPTGCTYALHCAPPYTNRVRTAAGLCRPMGRYRPEGGLHRGRAPFLAECPQYTCRHKRQDGQGVHQGADVDVVQQTPHGQQRVQNVGQWYSFATCPICYAGHRECFEKWNRREDKP